MFEKLDEANDFDVDGTFAHPESHEPDSLTFTGHPHVVDRVFVVATELEHGFKDFEEPKALGEIVRRCVKNLDPSAYVQWGIIEDWE